MTQDLPHLRAAAALAADKIERAAAMAANDDFSAIGSPQRARHVLRMGLISDALALLAPDDVHPDDGERARGEIAAAVKGRRAA